MHHGQAARFQPSLDCLIQLVDIRREHNLCVAPFGDDKASIELGRQLAE
jgi:hypothetical protein